MKEVDTRVRIKVPIWAYEFIELEAKERGVNLKDLASQAIMDWVCAEEQGLSHKNIRLSAEARETYREWVQERQNVRQKNYQEAKQRAAEREAEQERIFQSLVYRPDDEIIDLNDIEF